MSTYSFKEKSGIKKIGWDVFDNLARQVFDNATEILVDNMEQWAGATYRDFVNNTPIDTGNLQDSINIDEDEMPYAITVGVDESELFGPKTLKSKKYVTPKRGIPATRKIPARNYVLDSDGKGTPLETRTRDPKLLNFVSVIWQQQARIQGFKYLRKV